MFPDLFPETGVKMAKEKMYGKCKWVSHLSGSDYAVFYRKGTNHTIAVPPIALDPQQEVRLVQVQVDPLPRASQHTQEDPQNQSEKK